MPSTKDTVRVTALHDINFKHPEHDTIASASKGETVNILTTDFEKLERMKAVRKAKADEKAVVAAPGLVRAAEGHEADTNAASVTGEAAETVIPGKRK